MFADGPFSSLTFSTESNYVIFIDIRNVKLRTNVTSSNDGKTVAIEIRGNQVNLRTKVTKNVKISPIEVSQKQYKLRTKVEKARQFITGVNYISESEKPVIMENQSEF